MNCRPGDLALIARTQEETSAALGKPVRLIASCSIGGELCWSYEEMPLKGRCSFAAWTWYEIPDAWLRPIRPGDISDEEVRDLYAPKVPEAA